MTTFNQKLQIEKNTFTILNKEYKGFSKSPMQEVLAYLREYKAKTKESFAYNSAVKEYIKQKEIVSDDLADQLDTEVYLAQRYLHKEAEAKHTQEMADKGFIPCREWKGYTGKAQLVGRVEIDWAKLNLEKEGKITITNDGKDGFFIPKGKRSRGYYLRNLENAFFKPIT